MAENKDSAPNIIPFVPINDNYEFLDHAYTGGGGFLDGSYLVPHVQETPTKYSRRKALSYYANYVKTVVNSLVDPVFRKQAVRDWDGRERENELFSLFQKDVDRKGTTIQRFMKKTLKKAKLHGVAFLVVDNAPDQPVNQAEVIAQRAFPYVYLVQARQVKAYECNKDGILTSITYEIYSRQASGTAVTQKLAERWTWTETSWKKEAGGGTTETEHNLGVVPVIPLFGTEADDGDMSPVSDMLAIARINLAIFNLCSELREPLRNQAFAMLCYPITDSADFDRLKDMVTGTETALGYDGTAGTAPSFISPSADQAALIQNELSRLVDEIYRIANLTSVVGLQQKVSGVAKQWDFEQTNQCLADLAENCQNAELRIAYLFEKWTNSTLHYRCVYPDDFGIVDIGAALDEVTKAMDLNIGGKFQKEVKRKAAETFLGDLPEDRFDAVMEDIEQQTEAVQQAAAFKINPGEN
ncbi:Hypothetical protein LUCI_0788 [Lucifera butyrica]|uniref:Uncharacterized protein n=1 Tax=Lucifera butyrica TaxID=1351585 RepID=A0A498R8W3_9FIRM|nr:hypothetical protein [Lucifera butyrica]VBB05578.1 Hypothetical protein LUCI_0788 [Lucifera butyrica]